MKREARVLAVDDAPHRRLDATVPLVGVVSRGPAYVEGVLVDRCQVDGTDGTRTVVGMVRRSRFRPILRAVLLNGVFVGGFNLVDPQEVLKRTGLPVIALVRHAPRPALVAKALRTAFEDGDARWARVEPLVPVRLPGVRLWATVRGMTLREAGKVVSGLATRGNLPEPLRLAHVIASGLVRGESRGRA